MLLYTHNAKISHVASVVPMSMWYYIQLGQNRTHGTSWTLATRVYWR